jgi:hypothetical protein
MTHKVSTPVVWGEEFGWRGYLQIRLLADKPLWAAVATGLIWAVWHYPMILMGYLFSGNPLGLLLYPINMCLTSVIYGWFQLRSRSVWPASLAHATGNTLINPLLSSLLPNLAWPLVWAGYRGAVLIVLCVWIALRGSVKECFYGQSRGISTHYSASASPSPGCASNRAACGMNTSGLKSSKRLRCPLLTCPCGK